MNGLLADRDKFWQGLLIAVSALVVQRLLEKLYWQVLVKIEESILNKDSGSLILAAGVLVGLDSLRALPVFLGAFRAAEALKKKNGVLALLVAGMIIIAIFTVLYISQPGQWDWGVPLVVFLSAVALLLIWGRGILRFWHKLIILSQLLMGIYWLSVAPLLTHFGFGRGELPASIKLAADYLDAHGTLNFFSFAFFLPFVIIAVITTGLIDNYSKIIQHINAAKEQEKQIRRVRIAAAQARILEELHALVHDLKTPLTTIQGLSSLLEMTSSNAKQREYAGKISQSVENMNDMISEMLYEEVRKPTSVHALINYVRAQIILENMNQKFYFYIEENLPDIEVNKIRLARALVNVIENAIRATESMSGGEIIVSVKKQDGGVKFTVEDNGKGISQQDLARIWEPGFSSSKSSGLGLTFVRKVVEDHGGHIYIDSRLGKGTRVTIVIPRG
ncbi:MAG: HAMP domain-containing histidine kinase [Thermoanaerobacteraceae bacterium]|nr:HAMP domain-containing histidine kinase [Thermoanaerobacteraceae bacterium]